MKLHLPSGLRRSLLACIAALAAPVSTLGSSSFFAASALVSFSLASAPLALAEDYRYAYEGEDNPLEITISVSTPEQDHYDVIFFDRGDLDDLSSPDKMFNITIADGCTFTVGGIRNRESEDAANTVKRQSDIARAYRTGRKENVYQSGQEIRTESFTTTPGGSATLVIHVAQGEQYDAYGTTFGEGVSIVKSGEGTQRFFMANLDGQTKATDYVTVEGGKLLFLSGTILQYSGYSPLIEYRNTTYTGAYRVRSGATLGLYASSATDDNGTVLAQGEDVFRGKLTVEAGGIFEIGTIGYTVINPSVLESYTHQYVGSLILDSSAEISLEGSLSMRFGNLVLGQDLIIEENLYVFGYKGQAFNYANHIMAQGNDGVRTILFDIDSGEKLIKGESSGGNPAELTLTENIELRKTGAGTLKIDSALVILQNGGKIIVEEGTLEAGVNASASGFRFEGPSSEIRIENGAALVFDEYDSEYIGMSLDSYSGIITLAGGSTLSFKQHPETAGMPGQFIYGGILRAEGKGANGEKNVLDTAEVGLGWSNFIGQITSKAPDSADDTSELTIKLGNYGADLNVNKIYNYHGTIEVEKTDAGVTFLLCNVMETGGSSTDAQMLSRGYGNVEQQAGYEGTLLVYDYETDKASGTVEADVFRKIGDGTFALGRDAGGSDTPANQVTLKVNHRLFMDYAGNLMMYGGSKIVVGDGARLTYEKTAEEQMVKLNYDDIKGLKMLQLDFVEYKEDFNVLAEEGLALGIYTKDANESAREAALERLWKQTEGSEEGIYNYDANSLLCLYRLDESKIKLTLEWRPRGIDSLWPDYQNGGNDAWMLWMKAEISPTAFDSTYWDAQWGAEALFAPEADAMAKKEFGTDRMEELGFSFAETEGEFDTEGNNLQLGYNYKYDTTWATNLNWAGALPSHQNQTDPNALLSGSGDSPFVDRLGDLVDDSDGRGEFLLKDGKVLMAVRLVGGGAAAGDETRATVMGGRLYTAEDETDDGYDYNGNKREWWVVGESYISLRPKDAGADDGHFHLLIGGSSCVAERAPELDGNPVGGFRGNSHIQMEGGSVDYIVGGNHVNNSAFQFDGNSYISVLSGDVNGGIVGGCTLTRGAANTNVYAFRGTSTIYIYEVLGGKDAPDISDGTPSSDAAGGDLSDKGIGAAFNAVVGGNAWIDIARSVQTQEGVTPMNPTFFGNSYITIDLLTGQDELGFGDQTLGARKGQFEKAIVGGNYTVYQGSDDTQDDVLGARSTLFRGNAYITIKAGDDVTFTEGINGASRRNALGSGETNFTGNTSVTLSGGTYAEAVAGGFWMDASAAGDHHTRLEGHTLVTVTGGSLWRALGGSYSLEGGEGANEVHVGTSGVVVTGGEFRSKSEELEGKGIVDIGFVSGGDFYRNNNGADHKHYLTAKDEAGLDLATGELGVLGDEKDVALTSVMVTGGDFLNVHIVGGDTANASQNVTVGQDPRRAESEPQEPMSSTMATTIYGISQVTLMAEEEDALTQLSVAKAAANTGWAAEAEGKSIRVKGLVIGGSYLTDEGSGGGVTVGATKVSIGRGVYLTGADGHDSHRGLAVVGGNVLRDMGDATGGHTITVAQYTNIEVSEGATIVGAIVGGSYVTDAMSADGSGAGQNTLSSGDVKITLTGGSISHAADGAGRAADGAGHAAIYGGHYSENTTSPDVLTVGDISITVDGEVNVTGDIVGGGFRATKKDATGASTQGHISITLTSGSLKGNVYAAGYNGALHDEGDGADDAAAVTTTKSTTVTVGKDFVFDATAHTDQSIGSGILISGSYGRADSDVGRGTIGGTDKAQEPHVAKLIFEGTNTSINAHAADINFRNFDYVEVQAGEIKVTTDFYVLRRFENQAENDIYKTGVGTLSVNALNSWNSDDVGTSTARYTGHITVHQGHLKLTGEGANLMQDVSHGISFGDLGASQTKDNANNAYLSSVAGLMTKINDDLNNAKDPEAGLTRVKVEFAFAQSVEFTKKNKDNLKGDYYLASGFDTNVYKNSNRKEFFDYEDSLGEVQKAFAEIGLRTDVIMIGNSLVLSIYDLAPWTWMGTEGDYGKGTDHGEYTDEVAMVWYDDYRYNWSEREHGDEDVDNQPTMKDVHFSGNGTGPVKIHGMVTPRSVDVNAGTYIYVQEEGSSGGLSIGSLHGDPENDDSLAEGQLSVGGKKLDEGGYATAQLTLALANTAVPEVLLKEGGVLVLNHAQALVSGAGDDDTVITFEGGTLGYLGDDIEWAPYDTQVDDGSTGKAKVRVGNTLQGVGAVDAADATGRELAIAWGGEQVQSADNGGVWVALSNGMLKTGVGALSLEWQEAAGGAHSYGGTIDVLEGKLVYRMHGDDKLSFTDKGTITVGEGEEAELAQLVFCFSAGDKGTLDLAGAFTGSGTVTLGSAVDSGTYVLRGDSAGFGGTVVLQGTAAGATEGDVLLMNNGSLGGAGTTLRLAGRHFAYDADHTVTGDKVITLKEIQVVDGTVTYVGGKEYMEANAAITLKGLLSTVADAAGSANDAEHTGVLANAWGSDTEGFSHTYEGDISGFQGTIRAGAAATKGAAAGDASLSGWTLTGTLAETDLGVKLDGAGSIIFNYSQDIRLIGQIGGAGDDNLTGLGNTGAKVTIADGTGATWWDPDTTERDTNKAGKNTATGSLSGDFYLGDASAYGTWAGSELAGEGTLTMVNGYLTSGIGTKGADAKLAVATAYTDDLHSSSTHVDAGGTAAELFDSISVTLDGQLRGVTGQVDTARTEVALELGAANVGKTQGAADKQYLLVTSEDADGKSGLNVSVDQQGKSHFSLNMSNSGFAKVMEDIVSEVGRREKGEIWVHVVRGGELSLSQDLVDALFADDTYTGLFGALGFTASVQGGDLRLLGNLREIYLVIDEKGESDINKFAGDPHSVTSYGSMSNDYKATFVAAEQTLDIRLNSAKYAMENKTDSYDSLENGFYKRDLEQYGGLVVNNLVGMSSAQINVTNAEYAMTDDELDPSRRVKIVFLNSQFAPGEILGADDYEPYGVLGIDTEYYGTITAGDRVDFDKCGGGTLTIGLEGHGGLLTEDATVTLRGGGLTLSGERNTADSLVFAWTDDEFAPAADPDQPAELAAAGDDITAAKAKRRVLLTHGVTELGSISEQADWTDNAGAKRAGGDISLASGARLQLSGESALADSTITCDDASGAILDITSTGKLTLSGVSRQLCGVAGIVEGRAELGKGQENSLTSLRGGGSLSGDAAILTLTGDTLPEGVFSGTLAGTGELVVNPDAYFNLKNKPTALADSGGSGWALTNNGRVSIAMSGGSAGQKVLLGDVVNNGTLTFDLSHAARGQMVQIGSLTLGEKSTTDLMVNTDNWKPATTLHMTGDLEIHPDTFITVSSDAAGIKSSALDRGPKGTTRFKLMLVDGEVIGGLDETPGEHVTLSGSAFLHYTASRVYAADGAVWVEIGKVAQNRFIPFPDMPKNPKAGAGLFWDATDADKNPYADLLNDPNSDLGRMARGLTATLQHGSYHELCTALAAGAGASTSVLGPALLEDMHRQLRTIRNRTTQVRDKQTVIMRQSSVDGGKAGLLVHEYPEILPPSRHNFWVHAEGNYDSLRADSYAPGYTLTNWGGTVGAETSLTDTTSVGLALTAMFGRLRIDSSDSANGHMDTTYLTAFACNSVGAWSHTFILSAGRADVELNRSVSHRAGSYKAYGETDGYTLGAMYELAYSILLSEDKARVLQPVFNVEYRYAHMNGYTESGSDAGLYVGDISQSIITLGAGVRMSAIASSTAFNRNAFYELRALAKADVGERAGRVDNALIFSTPRREELKSARKGAVGAELGGGISVPVSENSNVFLDLSLELRSRYTNLDANIGYRINF